MIAGGLCKPVVLVYVIIIDPMVETTRWHRLRTGKIAKDEYKQSSR